MALALMVNFGTPNVWTPASKILVMAEPDVWLTSSLFAIFPL
jgi:hypothetical protein